MGAAWNRARAPATIANVGPGFDVFALAIRGLGDEVLLRRADADSLRVEGPESPGIPSGFGDNTAGIVLSALRRLSGIRERLEVRVVKGIPAGRGLGSSAASSAAAALAFLRTFPASRELGPRAFVQAAVEGETAVAGRHYDNVCGALFGGFVSIASTQPLALAREPVSPRVHIALAIPETPLRTAEMRKVLPRQVPLRDAVSNVGKAATLALALCRGDVALAGRCLEDRFAEPRRAPFLKGYVEAREAARRSGAAGFAISGSGSTVFALASSRRGAERAANGMRDAFVRVGVEARALATAADNAVPLRGALGRVGPRFTLVPR